MSRPIEPTDATRLQPDSGGHGVDIQPTGYLVIEGGPLWVCGRPQLEDNHISIEEHSLETYDLYERDARARAAGHQELVFALAGVETAHDACRVARRYGLLRSGPEAATFREPFALWETVAGQIRLVLNLVLALRDDDVDEVARLIEGHRTRLGDNEAADARALGSILVEGLVNEGLRRTREGVLSSVRITQDGLRGPTGQWHFAPQFDDLIGYSFHRLAQTINYRAPDLLRCGHCGRIIGREHPNQRYCPQRCAAAAKKRRHRARQIGAAVSR